MALARANDAVKLAYCQEPTEDEIRRLDLGAVAEFRRSNLGSVETRFIDRVKALQALAGMLEARAARRRSFPRDGAGGGGSVKEMIPLSLRQRKAFVWWARRIRGLCGDRLRRRYPLRQDAGDGNGLFLLGDGVLFRPAVRAVRAERGRAAAQPAGNGAAAAAETGLPARKRAR